MTQSFTKLPILLLLLCASSNIWAGSALIDSLSPKEKKEIEYLIGPKFQKKVLYGELSQTAKKRGQFITKAFLTEVAKSEEFKRREFIKNDPWNKWEKMENYNALNRWLQEVSPIITERPSTKDKL